MDIRNECIKIKSLDIKSRKEYLKDENFRKRLFESDGHYPFVWLVQDLKDEELLYLLDDNIIELLKNDSRICDKLNAIITCGNPYNKYFLKKTKVIELIYNNIENLKYYLGELDKDFGNNYFNYLLSLKDLDSIGYLNCDIQLDILKNHENLKKIKELNLNYEFLLDLDKEAIEYLLNDKYFENMFLKSPINSIAYIIKKKVKLPSNLSNNKSLINKYLSINDLIILLEYLTDLEENNKYLHDIIKDKLVMKYSSYEELKNKDDKDVLDIIIILNYEEIPYNFLKNIESMLGFIKQINKMIIPTDSFRRYTKIYNYCNLSSKDKYELFEEIFNDKNSMEKFYDDYKTCLNYSTKMLKESCLDIKELIPIMKKEDYGIDVYKLDGQKFKILINHTYYNRNGNNNISIWNDSKNYASLSLIGDTYLGTFRNPDESVILGFYEFDPLNIMHMYHSDSATSKKRSSNRIVDLFTPDDLLKNTSAYNEVLIKNSDGLKPSYVICYDKIKPGDIEASKSLGNIPIIIINTSKYNVNKTNIDLNENNYLTYSEASIMNRKGR